MHKKQTTPSTTLTGDSFTAFKSEPFFDSLFRNNNFLKIIKYAKEDNQKHT